MTTYTDGTEEATEPALDPASVVDGQTRDDFADKLGYGSWEEMVAAVAEHGSIIQGDYIRAELIDTNAIATDAAFIADLTGETAFINAISGTSFDFKQGKVGGFTIAAGKLYAGADFGAGAGVRMQSLAGDMGFKVYRNASNYVDMFYKDANNWGIRGMKGGQQYFALGMLEGADNNQIGGFEITSGSIKSSATSGNRVTLTPSGVTFRGDETFAAIGANALVPSTGLSSTARFENNTVDYNLPRYAIIASATGGGDAADGGYNVALDAVNGHIFIENGYLKTKGLCLNGHKTVTSNISVTVPKNVNVILANSGFTLSTSGIGDGQVVMVVNTKDSEITVKGTRFGQADVTKYSVRFFIYYSGYWYQMSDK